MDIPWIKPSYSPHNGEKIIELLEDVSKWRHSCVHLGGHGRKYDYFHSCYGNPDSKVMLIAEMPSLKGVNNAIKNRLIPKEMLWATPWYGGGKPPQIVRDALMANEFIPPFSEHEPWKWRCWITNFVKIPERTNKWNSMSLKQKGPYLLRSSDFLKREIIIIQPDCIIFLGNKAKQYFERSGMEAEIRKETPSLKPYLTEIRHYSGRESKDRLRRDYIKKFKQVRKNAPTDSLH